MPPRRPNPRAAHRVERLNELLREIIGDELRLIDDERLEMVSFTEVRTDKDLTHARVWFVGPDDDHDAEIVEALEEHRVRLQAAINRQARLRRTPPLHFEPDTTIRSATRIERILHTLEIPPDEPGDGDGTADPDTPDTRAGG
jgi:ribosome-binding factor A